MAESQTSAELVEITLNHEGNDVSVCVDLETANILLNDQEQAEKYVKELLEEVEVLTEGNDIDMEIDQGNSSTASLENVWLKKKPTTRDNEATSCFLELRLKYAAQFDDKKHVKNQLWAKIKDEMKEMGFCVGNGREGIEKLRQKFANLQKQYIKHIESMKKTGEGKREAPPFFDEMHAILGHKHKCDPKNVKDSVSSSDEEQITSENDCKIKEAVENRFKVKRNGKPSTSNSQIVNLMKEQHQADTEERKEQFQRLEAILLKQNEQRERLLDKMDMLVKLKGQKHNN